MLKQVKQKTRIEKLEKLSLILIVFIILFSSYVSGFGVGCAYHKDNSLEISPGETKEINFNLQNGPGPDDITAKPGITKGSEIIEIIDSGDILVPVGGSIDVKAKVSIPSDAKIGDIYPVEITFTTVTKSEAGAFGFGSSVGRSFDVIVVPTAEERARLAEQPTIPWITYLIIGIVILMIILVIWYILKKREK